MWNVPARDHQGVEPLAGSDSLNRWQSKGNAVGQQAVPTAWIRSPRYHRGLRARVLSNFCGV